MKTRKHEKAMRPRAKIAAERKFLEIEKHMKALPRSRVRPFWHQEVNATGTSSILALMLPNIQAFFRTSCKSWLRKWLLVRQSPIYHNSLCVTERFIEGEQQVERSAVIECSTSKSFHLSSRHSPPKDCYTELGTMPPCL